MTYRNLPQPRYFAYPLLQFRIEGGNMFKYRPQ